MGRLARLAREDDRITEKDLEMLIEKRLSTYTNVWQFLIGVIAGLIVPSIIETNKPLVFPSIVEGFGYGLLVGLLVAVVLYVFLVLGPRPVVILQIGIFKD